MFVMKPQNQLINHDPENGKYGDCYRTCYAVLFGLDAIDVPHFLDNSIDMNWIDRKDEWLLSMGYKSVSIPFDCDLDVLLKETKNTYAVGVPFILTGKSCIDCNHCVVVYDGKIYCDPSGNGIIGPTIKDNCYWIEFVVPIFQKGKL